VFLCCERACLGQRLLLLRRPLRRRRRGHWPLPTVLLLARVARPLRRLPLGLPLLGERLRLLLRPLPRLRLLGLPLPRIALSERRRWRCAAFTAVATSLRLAILAQPLPPRGTC